MSKDYSQNVDVPDNPGPAALGHEPLVGTLRRSNGMPVIREELAQRVDSTDAVDLPDDPVLPVLNTNR
jgi:hypothetical protein